MDPRPLVFLSLNDTLDEAECRRQVRRLAANGWGGFYMHVRQGLCEAFLGPKFMRAIRAMVEEARACGLTAWIYDEDRWPSGSGGGLAGIERHLRQRALCSRPAGWTPAGNETVILATADATYVEFIQEFDIHRAPGGCVGDLLNPETTARLISEAYEPYVAVVGDEFGRTVPGVFMDEPNVTYHFSFPSPSVPWTTGMAELYRARWGEDLVPLLPALFAAAPGAARARYRFRRLVEERLVEAFMRPLHDWCARHNLQFVGHLNAEESLSSIVRWAGISAAALPWFHVPGVDMLGRKIDEHTTLKTAVGVARQLGRPTQSELFGLAGAGATPEDLRWIADWHLANGVTRFCSHLVHFSLRGQRKHDCLPSIHSHQPYHAAIPALAARLHGLARLLDEGSSGAAVAVLQPMDGAWLETLPIPSAAGYFVHHPPEIHRLQSDYLAALEAVICSPRDADVLAEPLLAGPGAAAVAVTDGCLAVGLARYRAVVVPRLGTIRPATLRWLVTAAEAGVLVLATAPLPELIEGDTPGPEDVALLARLNALAVTCPVADVAARLDRHLPPTVQSEDHGGWLRVHERVLPQGRRLFLHHGDRRRGCTVRISGRQVDLVDADGRGREAVPGDGATAVLHLPPGGSALVECDVLGTGTGGTAPEARRLACFRPLPPAANTTWTATLAGANLLPLHHCRWLTPTGWSELLPTHHIHEQVVASGLRGPLRLRFACSSSLTVHAGLRLMVEEASAWRITVNGTLVSWDGSQPWLDPAFLVVPVGHCFQAGDNLIELEREWSAPRIFTPAHQPRHAGVEVAPLIVMGDFSLDALDPLPPRPHPHWDLTGLPVPELVDAIVPRNLLPPTPIDPSDITRSGAAHYCGEVVVDGWLDWSGGPARLTCAAVHGGVARLSVDDVDHGLLAWGPWSWELGDLAPGRHRIRLTLANTLRNVLSFMYHEQGDEHFVHLATYAYAQILATSGRPADLPPLARDRVRINRCGVEGIALTKA